MRELEAFLRGRAVWPPAEAFHSAGRFRLHQQVLLQGGESLWATRFHLPVANRQPNRWPWTDERIRGALRLYLANKQQWPTRTQFQADGQRALRLAITRAGGIDRWVEEFDLPRPHRRNGHHHYWTDQRIHAQLTELCDGQEAFPSINELKRAGLAGMTRAMRTGRGLEWWANELHLRRRESHSGRVPTPAR